MRFWSESHQHTQDQRLRGGRVRFITSCWEARCGYLQGSAEPGQPDLLIPRDLRGCGRAKAGEGSRFRGAALRSAAPRLASKRLPFPNQGRDLGVEALSVALPPEAHVGGVVLPAALVGGAHGEELPAIAAWRSLPLPAVQARAAGPSGKLLLLL